MIPISSSRLYPINNTFLELDDEVDVPASKRQCTGELPSSNAITSLSKEYLRQLDTALENLKISENNKECTASLKAHLEQFPPLESLTTKERFETGFKLFESKIDIVRAHKLLCSAVNDLYMPALKYITEALNYYKIFNTLNGSGLSFPPMCVSIYGLMRGKRNSFYATKITEGSLSLFEKALKVAHLRKVSLEEILLSDRSSLIHSIFNNNHKFTSLAFECTLLGDNAEGSWSDSEQVEIAQALASNTTLEKLRINTPLFSNEVINTITTPLMNHKSLKRLSLYQAEISLSAASIFGTLLSVNQTITHLTLSRCSLSVNAISKIAAGLLENFTLESLSLQSTQFPLADLVNLSLLFSTVAPRNTTLTHLDLSHVNLNHKDATPEMLRGSLTRFFSHYSPLESLSLVFCGIGTSHIPVFDAYTPCNTNLTHLDLSTNILINQPGLLLLSNMLTKITSLQLLNLDSTQIGLNENRSEAVNGGVDPLCEILRTNTSMTSLRITDCALGKEGIPKLKNAVFGTKIRKPLISREPMLFEGKSKTEISKFIEDNKHNYKKNKRTLYDLLVKSLSKELLYD